MSSIIKPVLGSQLNLGHPLATGLVGLWLFNEGSGGQVFDLSGNNSTGVFSGDATLWVPGRYGPAVSFGGTDDWIDISDDNLPPFGTGDFTIVVWCKHPQDASDRAIFSKGSLGAGEFTLYKSSTNKPTFYGDNGSILIINNVEDSWPDDVWTQIAAKRQGSVGSIFIDTVIGNTVDSSAGGDLNTATDWRIGARGDGGRDYAGLIDSVLIYNRALSASEVALLYREPFCMFERDPIELWSAATLGAEPPAGMAGAMTINTGYWGW